MMSACSPCVNVFLGPCSGVTTAAAPNARRTCRFGRVQGLRKVVPNVLSGLCNPDTAIISQIVNFTFDVTDIALNARRGWGAARYQSTRRNSARRGLLVRTSLAAVAFYSAFMGDHVRFCSAAGDEHNLGPIEALKLSAQPVGAMSAELSSFLFSRSCCQ